MRLSDLLQQRARLRTEAEKIVKAAEDASRLPDDNEQKRLDEIRTEADGLETRIRNQALIDEIDRNASATTVAGDEFQRELRAFSLARLLASSFEPSIDAAREREICQEQATRAGRQPQGFLIPFEVLAPQRRVLTVAGDAANLVSTEVLGNEFIDALRPAAVATRLGARTITGLSSDISFPKRDQRTPTAAWFAENTTITTGDQSFAQVSGTPRHLGLTTEYSRKTLLQATAPGIEEMARQHFIEELGVGLDLGVLKGAGAPAPTGITATAGIGTLNSGGAAPTWANVLDVMALVEAADVPLEGQGWVVNAHLKSTLRGTTKVSGDGGAGFILEATANNLAGAPVATSSQLAGNPGTSPPTAAEAIFGAWPQLIVALWSGVDILVNPFLAGAYEKGNISVRGIVDADVLVRHPAAFAHWQNILL